MTRPSSTSSATTAAGAGLQLGRASRDPLDDLTIDLGAIVGFFVRNLKWLLLGALIGAMIGAAWSLTETKVYTATARVLYATVKGAGSEERTTTDTGLGDSSVDAQIELIRSDATVDRVIDGLHLQTDQRAAAAFSRLSWLAGFLGDRKPLDHGLLASVLDRNLKVERIGRSQILEIAYTGPDSAFAADIANAFGQAYVETQLAANTALAAKTSEWLSGRIVDLGDKSASKDAEIEAFKAEHNLFVGADGKSYPAQRIEAIGADILTAEARIGELAAKSARLTELAKSPLVADSVSTDDDPGLAELQARYTTASDRRVHLTTRLGDTNGLVRRLDRDIAGLRSAIADRSLQVVRATDQQIAIAREQLASLRAERDRLSGEARSSESATAQLARLQAAADVLRKAYADSLGRYETALRDQSYPVADARVIAAAAPPANSDSMSLVRRVMITTVLGGVLALFIVVLVTFWRRFGRDAVAADKVAAAVGRG